MPLLDRADSVLVVVDAQPGFYGHPAMSDVERESAAAALARATWLAGLATDLDVPAVVVEEGVERAGRTNAELLERLAPATPVIAKSTFSLAGQPEAVAAIRATGRGTIVLTGFETDTCVAQSAVELHDLGLRVAVAADAACSSGAEQHRRGLDRMRQAGVEVTHCKSVVYEWLRVVDAALAAVRAATDRYGPPPFRL
jgi:nicotinamidase-related amidase